MTVLRFQSFATQQSDMLALKFWYGFGIRNIQPCSVNHFCPPNMNLRFFLNEIDNFIVFLENNKKLETNLIRLRSNIDANYMTITQRLRSLFKYFAYLLDEYWNIRYQDITIKELTNRRKKIDLFLLNKKGFLVNFPNIV